MGRFEGGIPDFHDHDRHRFPFVQMKIRDEGASNHTAL